MENMRTVCPRSGRHPPDMSGMNRGEIGTPLRALRERAGLTQKQLALAAQCAEITLRKIERGERNPSPALLHAIVAVLGTTQPDAEQFHAAAGLPHNDHAPRHFVGLAQIFFSEADS
jgi:transcriptional regulator with XRE-family HTH domain